MLDLTKKVLPSAILVGGSYVKIKTDWRLWVRFTQLLEEDAAVEDLSFLFQEGTVPEQKEECIKALMDFAFPKKPLPRSDGKPGEKILDYRIDADLIYSAFREQYGIDLIKTDMHWHTFSALLGGLHNTKLNEIMSARSYDPNDHTKYEEAQLKMKNAWTLEGVVTSEDEVKKESDFDKAFS